MTPGSDELRLEDSRRYFPFAPATRSVSPLVRVARVASGDASPTAEFLVVARVRGEPA
jgi:hypothetical protein